MNMKTQTSIKEEKVSLFISKFSDQLYIIA